MKRCCACKEEKSSSAFHKDRQKEDGHTSRCKDCCKLSAAKTREGKPHPYTVLRYKALRVLGVVCSRCGFDDIRALQIDHINGGGKQEHKELGTYNVYKRIADGCTEGYQVLCANCNWIKRYENEEVKTTASWCLAQEPKSYPR